MKKILTIIISIIIFITIIIIAYLKINSPDQFIAIAKSGLKIRELPGLDAKQLGTIPYHGAVSIIDEKNDLFSIEDVEGKWVKVNWNHIDGWVFNGYLVPIGAKIVLDSYLFNSIEYNNNELNKIIDKYCPKSQTSISLNDVYCRKCKAHCNLNANMFSKLPSLIPDDDIIVVTPYKIIYDKIKSLYIEGIFDYYHILFDLYKYKIDNPANDPSIFFKKFNQSCNLNVIKLHPVDSNESFLKDLSKYISTHKNMFYDFSFYVGDMNDSSAILNILKSKYQIKFSKFSNKKSGDDVLILSLTTKDVIENMLTIIYRNKIVYCNYGKLLSVFNINNIDYIYLDMWGLDSGLFSRMLFMVDQYGIKKIKEDNLYSN